jgi:hypothetical protein
MSQLLQSIGGVEFWKCLNCDRVRRITGRNINTIFIVPPQFCSVKCMHEYRRFGPRNQADQMTLVELPDAANS